MEPPTRPRLECLRETGLILRCDRKVGKGFKEYVDDYGYEPDEVRPINSWARDYIAYLEVESNEVKETE